MRDLPWGEFRTSLPSLLPELRSEGREIAPVAEQSADQSTLSFTVRFVGEDGTMLDESTLWKWRLSARVVPEFNQDDVSIVEPKAAKLRTVNVFVLLLVLVLNSSMPVSAQQHTTADAVVYFHANVLTGEGLNSSHPVRVSALAVRAGTIVATGADAAILKRWRGPSTEVVDLRGAFVMPGFNDAHLHLASAGFAKLQIDLLGSASLEEIR